MSTITELRSSNVKRLTAVSISPPASGAVVIGGKNGQGKSSLLDSILYGLGGASSMPDKPVRTGEEKAEISITISTNPPLVVTRKIKADGKTTLEIKQKSDNGIEAKVSSPQKVLDSLVGAVAFDPLEFTRQKPQMQVESLKQLVGVETVDIDSDIEDTMEARKKAKQELANYEAVTHQMPHHVDIPSDAEPLAIEDVRKELADAQVNNKRIEDLEQEITDIEASIVRWKNNIEELRRQLSDAEAMLAEEEKSLDEAQEESAGLALIDLHPILQKSSTIGVHNQKIAENAARAIRVKEHESKTKAIDELTTKIEGLRNDRIKLMDSAKWPVEGLGFDSQGVTFNGLPFTQCSSAEQLRISTAIGLAQNPQLKLMLIRDGSLLDEDNLEFLHEMAVANEAQVWIERVSRGDECSLIIEAGEVAKPFALPELEAVGA